MPLLKGFDHIGDAAAKKAAGHTPRSCGPTVVWCPWLRPAPGLPFLAAVPGRTSPLNRPET
jgi:hypothetical protein